MYEKQKWTSKLLAQVIRDEFCDVVHTACGNLFDEVSQQSRGLASRLVHTAGRSIDERFQKMCGQEGIHPALPFPGSDPQHENPLILEAPPSVTPSDGEEV